MNAKICKSARMMLCLIRKYFLNLQAKNQDRLIKPRPNILNKYVKW